MADTQYGLLVDYTYFSGNHAAEIACKEELGLPLEQFGIKEVEVGPFRKGRSKNRTRCTMVRWTRCTRRCRNSIARPFCSVSSM